MRRRVHVKRVEADVPAHVRNTSPDMPKKNHKSDVLRHKPIYAAKQMNTFRTYAAIQSIESFESIAEKIGL